MKLTTNLLMMMGLLACCVGLAAQTAAAHFDMSLDDNGNLVENISGQAYPVTSQLPACTVEGLDGAALRFDGYSSYVKAGLPVSSLSRETLTVSITLAAESYPMVAVKDEAEAAPAYATICGNLDVAAKRGFDMQLSSQGDIRFRYGSAYAGGYVLAVSGSEKLPRGQWCRLDAVLDKGAGAATLYLNGRSIGTGRMNRSEIVHSDGPFYIGKDDGETRGFGPFLVNTFCGLIDDIAVSNQADTPSPFTARQRPDFSYPASRYAANRWRPQFHAMPSGSWTNETHGMMYSDGRYHVFFQKNPNGPYMARLHWGHISSANLCQWRDEPIAVYPSEPFDLKGCWSGCVYEDGGTPYLLYTGVDNAKARIVQARATDATLADWTDKQVVVDGRPGGLSDDFRDPYYFEANGNKYIIAGTSKTGVGACTLHQLKNGSWTNDGTLFFQGATANQHGTFWEMPNVTPMGDGRWLFTCTPQNTGAGVRTLCWVGTIGLDGKFTPSGEMQTLEMGGISRDGYGLLSPTICQQGGKTILLGIVPDKLPTQTNYEMGWAHNYSLPREVSLDGGGLLVQRPYSGLTAMRTATTVSKDVTLLGRESLSPVSGRQLELLGQFTVSTGVCGFHFLKAGDRQATLAYDAATGRLSLTTTAEGFTNREASQWTAALPQRVNAGETLTLHVFLDGSIADIFAGDRWAFSVRLYPTDDAQVEAEAFATAPTVSKLTAWTLDARQTDDTAVREPLKVNGGQPANAQRYNLLGQRVQDSHRGIVIMNGRKIIQ